MAAGQKASARAAGEKKILVGTWGAGFGSASFSFAYFFNCCRALKTSSSGTRMLYDPSAPVSMTALTDWEARTTRIRLACFLVFLLCILPVKIDFIFSLPDVFISGYEYSSCDKKNKGAYEIYEDHSFYYPAG
jgi:hypothetical protein